MSARQLCCEIRTGKLRVHCENRHPSRFGSERARFAPASPADVEEHRTAPLGDDAVSLSAAPAVNTATASVVAVRGKDLVSRFQSKLTRHRTRDVTIVRPWALGGPSRSLSFPPRVSWMAPTVPISRCVFVTRGTRDSASLPCAS